MFKKWFGLIGVDGMDFLELFFFFNFEVWGFVLLVVKVCICVRFFKLVKVIIFFCFCGLIFSILLGLVILRVDFCLFFLFCVILLDCGVLIKGIRLVFG